MASRHLVNTRWLEEHLDDPRLRIFDCTVHRRVDDDGVFRIARGDAEYKAGHIPGARHLDLVEDLSEPESPLRFTLPTPERFAEAVSRAGVSDDCHVVVYGAREYQYATRLWWMFRVFGFDNVALLDGGWHTWASEGRPVTTEVPNHPVGHFTPRYRPELVADKAAVLTALNDANARVINGLAPNIHAGEVHVHYGPDAHGDRPGRIAGSVNLFAGHLINAQTKKLLPRPAIESLVRKQGIPVDARLITYCGAGIAATACAFALALLGREDVAVYDASLQEWAHDATLPMESDVG